MDLTMQNIKFFLSKKIIIINYLLAMLFIESNGQSELFHHFEQNNLSEEFKHNPQYEASDDRLILISPNIQDNNHNNQNLESFLFENYPQSNENLNDINNIDTNQEQPFHHHDQNGEYFYAIPRPSRVVGLHNNKIKQREAPIEPILLQSQPNIEPEAKGSVELPLDLSANSFAFHELGRMQQWNSNTQPSAANKNVPRVKTKTRAKAIISPTFDSGIVTHPFRKYAPTISNKKKGNVQNHRLKGDMESVRPLANNNIKQQESSIDPNEVKNLMKQLRVIDTSLNDTSSGDESDFIDHESLIDNEDLDEMRKLNKIDRILPTSHLFGGSIGLVNESKIGGNNVSKLNDQFKDIGKEEKKKTSDQDIEDKEFVNSIVRLASMLSESKAKKDRTQASPSEISRSPLVDERKGVSVIESHPSSGPPIPIEALVDRLMASSRFASFSPHHIQEGLTLTSQDSNNLLAPIETEALEASEDEEDDEDEDDTSTNEPEGSSSDRIDFEMIPMDSEESKIDEVATSNFSSVAKMDDSWVPLKSLVNETSKLIEQTQSRKKRNDRESYWIMGNKVVSRTDLIRMIKLLNQSASSSIPSKERESSRKLLRFMIKLALEDFRDRQNRLKVSKINEDSENQDHNLVQTIMKNLLTEPDENKDMDRSLINNKSLNVNENNSKVEEGAKPVKSFKELSKDLEQYFDREFFEDLADKRPNSTKFDDAKNNEKESEASSYKEIKDKTYGMRNETNGKRLGVKTRRPPVRTYEQRDIEEADEDDVELDHIRSVRGRHSERDRKRNYPRKRRGRQRGHRIMNGSNRSSRRKRPSGYEEDIDRDREPEADSSNEPDYDYRESERDRPKRRHQRRRKHRDSRAGRYRELEDNNEHIDDELTEEQADNERPSRISPRDSRAERSRLSDQGDDKANDDDESDDRGEEDGGHHRRKKSRTKSSTRARKARARARARREHDRAKSKHKGKQIKSNKVEVAERDDIPAPIVSAKPIRLIRPTRVTKEAKYNSTTMIGKKGAKSKQTINSPVKESDAKPHKSKPDNQKRKRPSRKKQNEIKGSNDKKVLDPDNYDEGTSYSQICDDAGPCKVSVKSNSPKLGRAIKNKNDTAISKQLDKWMDEPD